MVRATIFAKSSLHDKHTRTRRKSNDTPSLYATELLIQR